MLIAKQHLLWKRLLSYIPPPDERTVKEHRKYDRYLEYINKSVPTEKDWAEYTFSLLQKDQNDIR